MKLIKLPYDKSQINLRLEESNIAGVLTAKHHTFDSGASEIDIVQKTLQNPIGSVRVSDLAVGKKKIVVITSDHTRSLPSSITLPLLLAEIRKGNPEADITVLIATGLHRGMTDEEKIEKFGLDIFNNEKLINHKADDLGNMVFLGTLPSGSKCELNRIACEADLLVAEGFIEPHFFAGFSGGRKSVLPGIASVDCVNINHSAQAIASPYARNGVLTGNPLHEDMIRACELIGLDFILNVRLNEKKKIIAAYAGDFRKAHEAGCKELLDSCSVEPIMADIVISTNGGYPLDQNLYQAPKGLAPASDCVKDGGVIILVVACRDGIGGANFGKMMTRGKPQELMDIIFQTAPEKTLSEQWCVQRFAEEMLKHRIILVTNFLEKETVERMNFIHAPDIDEALRIAFDLKGKDAKVTVIPDGVSVITKREE